ncbi:hypothetical protein EMCRGX_G016456 [Ephydatia muelleri]
MHQRNSFTVCCVISLSMLKDMFFIMYIVWEDEYKEMSSSPPQMPLWCYQGFCQSFQALRVQKPHLQELHAETGHPVYPAHRGPIHLRPTRLPLTVAMLGQTLRRLERAALKQHDCLMLRAALTLGFFSFLRVGEFTMKTGVSTPGSILPCKTSAGPERACIIL